MPPLYATKPREYPPWFDYETDFFLAEDTNSINKQLVERGIDAREVITIFLEPTLGGYQVFYRKRVN